MRPTRTLRAASMAGEMRAARFTPGSWALVAVLALAGLLVGCGRDRPQDEVACSPVVEEPLDPGSALHLLPGAMEPSYRSDPPTSGPHRAGPAPRGVVESPLDRPTQVQVLEQGGVVIQHRDLGDEALDALVGLAGDRVVVAPAAELASPVVATAWQRKLTCERVEVEALERFVDTVAGEGPEEPHGRGPAPG